MGRLRPCLLAFMPPARWQHAQAGILHAEHAAGWFNEHMNGMHSMLSVCEFTHQTGP